MKKILCVCAMLALLAVGSEAAVIGLNFTDGWPTPMLGGGETADGFSNWTDSMGNMGGGGTNPQLGTNTLAGSSVQAIFHSANTWAAGNENDSEQQLYRVYLDDGDGGSSLVNGDGIGVSVTLSGLGTWLASSGDSSYTIRAYGSTDWGTAPFQSVDVRLGAPNPGDGANQLLNLPILEAIAIPTLGDGAFPTGTGGGGSRGYGDSSSLLNADVITLTIPINNGTARGTLAGFKITTIPEPATGGMIAIGLAVLLKLRRRRSV